MSTSNNNKTAERPPSSPLATAERMTPSLLASNKLLFSTPVHNHSNTYTPGVDSPHSHPPHHEGMRDQSLSLYPYSGRDSDSNGSMTPMSAPNNKTTKSSLISSNHHSNNSNNHHSQNSNNNNTTLTSNNNNTASTISSPPSHPLHHQGSGGASSTNSSHFINRTEECVESILALSPLPILSKVPGLTANQVRVMNVLPHDYIPVYFASNNNAFHLAFLAWYYDHLLLISQPGDAREYLFKLYDQLHGTGHSSFTNRKVCKQHSLNGDIDYIYEIILKIDEHTGHRQFAMSLLWHNVWLLQLLPSSQLQYKLKYTEIEIKHIIEMIGNSIAYWLDIITYKNIPNRFRFSQYYDYSKHILHVMDDKLRHQHDMLHQIRYAMHRQEIRRSSPSPIPSTQERGESKSMSVVSAPSPPAAPLALSSQNHSTQARMGSVPTQSVSMQHTAKQPPQDDSPRRREKSSYSPTQSTQKRAGEFKPRLAIPSTNFTKLFISNVYGVL